MTSADLSVFLHAALWFIGWLIFCRVPRLNRRPAPSFRPQLSVIVPARDAESRIAPLLESLQRQSFPPLEVLVVDDHSTDNTAALARQLRATVISGAALPDGWRGKNWACHQGAQKAAGEWLLFLDADCWLEPNGLEVLIGQIERWGGVLSLQPFHRVRRPYEHLSAMLNLVQMMASLGFTVFGSGLRGQQLFGPSLLINRKAYLEAGGHQAVKGEALENVRLSRVLADRGVPLQCFVGRGVINFRMYPEGFRSLWRGWSRAFSTGAAASSRWALLATVLWFTGALGTFRHFLMAALGLSPASPLLLLLFYGAYAGQILWMLRAAGAFSPWVALAYPLSMVFFVGVFLSSLIQRFMGRSTTWKGRPLNP